MTTALLGIPDIVYESTVIQALHPPHFEDRALIEFSLAGITLPIRNAELHLTVHGSNGPYPLKINVCTYYGNGKLTLSDWYVGDFLTRFGVQAETKYVQVDVTSRIQAAVEDGAQFVGFRLEFALPSTIPFNGPYASFRSIEYPPAASLWINEPQRWVGP